jgi:hypothetical protein
MNSCEDTARAVGCPIRISTDQSLLAAPHGFSQRATSFIASWCQGIHRMPFSYSIQCPSAEADRHTMHRNHPQTVPGTGPLEATPKPRRSFRQEPFFAHNRIPSGPPFSSIARALDKSRQPDKIVHTPLNPRRTTAGALIPKDSSPGQTCNRTTGPPSNHGFATTDRLRSHASRDAPEPDSP